MESQKNTCSRREFMSTTAMGLLGYSLMVSVDADASTLSDAQEMKEKSVDMMSRVKENKKPLFSQPSMDNVLLDCDVLVAGGGLSGICAAIAAAREGAKVVLVQNRSRLGGNASMEVKMHPLGINPQNVGFREAGILEELKLKNSVENPDHSWAVWDCMLYDKVRCEQNITLLLDTTVYGADVENSLITKAYARCDLSLTNYIISAKQYIDCTGDSRLAIEAGAEVMTGRDGSEKYGESLAGHFTKDEHLCCSMMFTSVDVGHEVKYTPPSWAKKITAEHLKFRDPAKWGFNYGYWFLSFGGKLDTVRDMEVIRRELLAILHGVWNYVKNVAKYPEAKNRVLDFVAMFPARRDTYRIAGYDIFTQHDIEGKWAERSDQIITVGWPMEDQPSDGFYFNGKPAIYGGTTQFYNLPLTAMYSKDVKNLFMAGRNMNTSHIAFTSTRVMNVGALAGEVVGNAAVKCVRENINPRQLGTDATKLNELRQKLLKNGNVLVNYKNEDPNDLVLKSTAWASDCANSTSADNAKNGITYDFKDEVKNRWQGDISKQPELTFSWEKQVEISQVRLNLDTGSRFLTQSEERGIVAKMLAGAQPETLRDFDIIVVDENNVEKLVVSVRDNYQKLVVLDFKTVKTKTLKVKCLATNGDANASIFEVRAYS